MRLNGYQINMKKEAQLFKSLADETRLRILWLLMAREELCVCDIMGVLASPSPRPPGTCAIYII
jgi:DNA-binding transcriptional ArsR family regulator